MNGTEMQIPSLTKVTARLGRDDYGIHLLSSKSRYVFGDAHGRIHLELGKGHKEEAERDLALLRRVADAGS
jgi:hypothetical protein